MTEEQFQSQFIEDDDEKDERRRRQIKQSRIMKDSITPSDKDATNAVKNINDVFPREQPETIATNSTVTPSKEDSERTCPDCDGYGELSPDRTCPRCEGSGTIDATPSKEAKHTSGPKERKWKLLQMPDGGTLADIHGNVIAEIFNNDDAEFIFHAPELAKEVEDLRKDRDKWKERELNMQVNCNRELEELNKVRKERDLLRERIRELAEALTWSSDLFRLLMNNSVDFTDAEKMKISAIAVLSRNESNRN